MSGDKDLDNFTETENDEGKHKVTINIDLAINIFPKICSGCRSHLLDDFAPVRNRQRRPFPPFPKRSPAPDSPNNDDSKPFRFYLFRQDDYFDEEQT